MQSRCISLIFVSRGCARTSGKDNKKRTGRDSGLAEETSAVEPRGNIVPKQTRDPREIGNSEGNQTFAVISLICPTINYQPNIHYPFSIFEPSSSPCTPKTTLKPITRHASSYTFRTQFERKVRVSRLDEHLRNDTFDFSVVCR